MNNSEPQLFTQPEREKIHAEIANLMAETAKLNREAAKLGRDAYWQPFIAGAAMVTAAATLGGALVKFLS